MTSNFKGRKHTEEAKEKNRLAHLGVPSKKKGKPSGVIPKTAFKRGQTPWNYIDGRSRKQAWNRYGPEWKKIRQAALIRDNFTCQHCGRYGIRLEVHHKIPFLLTRDNRLENLQCLCGKCHRTEEARIMKQLKTQVEVT